MLYPVVAFVGPLMLTPWIFTKLTTHAEQVTQLTFKKQPGKTTTTKNKLLDLPQQLKRHRRVSRQNNLQSRGNNAESRKIIKNNN